MDDEILLHIDTGVFFMTMEEAATVCNILNGANRVTNKYMTGGSKPIIAEPDNKAAVITPITAYFRIALAQNMKQMDEEYKK